MKVADILYESNWQDLPVNLQKNFILMIGNAARPLQYDAFGIAPLNLETYTNVNIIGVDFKKRFKQTSMHLNKLIDSFLQILNSVCSYYMMFRNITSD